jgi:hypothetical protein
VEPGGGLGGFGLTVLAGILLLAMPVLAWRWWFRAPSPADDHPPPAGDTPPTAS